MDIISMNDFFYGSRESVQILKDEDREILETIHRYNYFYAEPPSKPEPEVTDREEDEEEIQERENARETERLAQAVAEKKKVIEEKRNLDEKEGRIVLKVPMCCTECEDTVIIVLKNVTGVEDVETSQLKQKVAVTGNAAAADILLACRDLKIFRKTQFWNYDTDN